jgi:endonuclease-3
MTREQRSEILERELPEIYPDAHCELDFKNPLELLVATILSAQCTDVRVNMVTKSLFKRCKSAADYAGIPQVELEEIIRSTGFYRNKAKSLRGMGEALVERHGGKVPRTMEELSAIPGAGRKTANVVLGNAFDINEGVVVDTHVGRLSLRLGLTANTEPVKVEQDLMKLFPKEKWTLLSHWLIWHGRRRCKARNPDCGECELRSFCPSVDRPQRLIKK